MLVMAIRSGVGTLLRLENESRGQKFTGFSKQQLSTPPPPPPPPAAISGAPATFFFCSGPETAESLISGPQSANTEASVKTEASIKPETSKAASGDDSGNRSASPSASLQGFLLTDSPRGTASCNGSGSDAAASASASVPTRSVMRQREEENDDDAGDCAETASSQAEGADQDSALAGALRAPRRGTGAPRDTQVSKEPAEDAAPTAVPGDGRGSGLAHNSVERAAEGKGEDWGGQSEGMFRKRVSFELKAMLALNGGTCTMQALAATFKRHRHRLLNLQGKKVCLLVWSRSKPTQYDSDVLHALRTVVA